MSFLFKPIRRRGAASDCGVHRDAHFREPAVCSNIFTRQSCFSRSVACAHSRKNRPCGRAAAHLERLRGNRCRNARQSCVRMVTRMGVAVRPKPRLRTTSCGWPDERDRPLREGAVCFKRIAASGLRCGSRVRHRQANAASNAISTMSEKLVSRSALGNASPVRRWSLTVSTASARRPWRAATE